MNNLFSIFDARAIGHLPWNWVIMAAPVLLTPPLFWLSPNPITWGLKFLHHLVKNELRASFETLLRPGTVFLPVIFFSLIVSWNLLRILPFVFTPTAHLSLTLSLAMPLWIGYIVFSTLKAPTNFFAHLVPSGTPPLLIRFIVVIELVSLMIRPFTLSIRLAANLVAGHLLLSLLGNLGVALINPFVFVVLRLAILLIILELRVAIIQGFVFSLLIRLYVAEVHPSSLS